MAQLRPTAIATPVSREAFESAVISGDLDTIEAYVAQPHVRSEIEATEAYIVEVSAATESEPTTFTLRDGSLPWFRHAKKSHIDTDDFPLLRAARCGHVHVIEWFFSRDRAAFMSATLALLLPLVAKYDGRWQWWISDPLVLDALLSSQTFCGTMDETRKQTVLDEITGSCQSFEVISVAIAHGARVNEALQKIARDGADDIVAQLDEAGALLVGADLLQPPFASWRYKCARGFLEHGVDWGNGTAMVLNGAAVDADEDAVRNLLSHGFVDVDARYVNGMTPLMHVSTVDPAMDLHLLHGDPTPRIVRSLLEYCDVDATDDFGCTALHYAVRTNSRVADILIDVGIDVTIRNNEGSLALDIEDDGIFRRLGWQNIIEQFLESGLDPYEAPRRRDPVSGSEEDEVEGANAVSPNVPRSLYDRLLEAKGGPEFIRDKSWYFNREVSDAGCVRSAGAAEQVESTRPVAQIL